MKTVLYAGKAYRLNRYGNVWAIPASGSLRPYDLKPVGERVAADIRAAAVAHGLREIGRNGRTPYFNISELPDILDGIPAVGVKPARRRRRKRRARP